MTDKSFVVSTNVYGGVSWELISIPSLEDMIELCSIIANSKFINMPRKIDKKLFIKVRDVFTTPDRGTVSPPRGSEHLPPDSRITTLFLEIREFARSTDTRQHEVPCQNSWERLIVHAFAEIFGFRQDKILRHEIHTIECTRWAKEGDEDGGLCGCRYAPRWFLKCDWDLNYEDTIRRSYVPHAVVTGLRLTKE